MGCVSGAASSSSARTLIRVQRGDALRPKLSGIATALTVVLFVVSSTRPRRQIGIK